MEEDECRERILRKVRRGQNTFTVFDDLCEKREYWFIHRDHESLLLKTMKEQGFKVIYQYRKDPDQISYPVTYTFSIPSKQLAFLVPKKGTK